MFKIIKYVIMAGIALFVLDVAVEILDEESDSECTEYCDDDDDDDDDDWDDDDDEYEDDDDDDDYWESDDDDDEEDDRRDRRRRRDDRRNDGGKTGGKTDADDDDDVIVNTPIGNDNNDDEPVVNVPVVTAWGDGTLRAITSSEFNKLIANTNGDHETFIGKGPSVVTFWADASDYCKQLNTKLATKAKEYKGKVQFYKINVDDNSDIYERYELESIPTTFFCVGEDLNILTGLPTDAILEARIKDILK